jgi:hypothetical protein
MPPRFALRPPLRASIAPPVPHQRCDPCTSTVRGRALEIVDARVNRRSRNPPFLVGRHPGCCVRGLPHIDVDECAPEFIVGSLRILFPACIASRPSL